MENAPKTPRWFIALAVIAALPIFSFPALLSMTPPGTPARAFIYLYIPYTILAAWLACLCYPRRATVAWMVLALLLLTHAAIWALALYPPR